MTTTFIDYTEFPFPGKPGQLFGWNTDILRFGSSYFFIQIPGSTEGTWMHPYPPKQILVRFMDNPTVMYLGHGETHGFVVCLVGDHQVEVRREWIHPITSSVPAITTPGGR